MNDYSDLIFLIGAIAIYGMLVTNTNRALVLNNQLLTDSEIEYGAISVAQNIIDEARWISYEELNEDYEEILEALYDKLLYQDAVNIQTLAQTKCPTSKPCKKVEANITSEYLKNGDGSLRVITMSLIKTDY